MSPSRRAPADLLASGEPRVAALRFAAAVERLTPFPGDLPPPAVELLPVLVGTARPPTGVAGTPGSARPAAVLVLLYPDAAGVARIVLTERVVRDGHHSGEVSFPGGRAEPGDDGPAGTALREAAEEIALDATAAGVTVIGELEPFLIPVSDFHVTPVVAIAERPPTLVPSPAEVARILEPPMARFLPGAPIEMVERVVRDWPLRYGAYEVDGLSVWGATARVLNQLGRLLAEPG